MASYNGSKMMVFIGVFISALVGLLFAPQISTQVTAVQTAINDSSSLEHTLYGYVPAFYALLMIGLMVGSLYKMFK